MKTLFAALIFSLSISSFAAGPMPPCPGAATDAAWKLASQNFPSAQLQVVNLSLGITSSKSVVNWLVTVEERLTGSQRNYQVLATPPTCQIISSSEIPPESSYMEKFTSPNAHQCDNLTGCERSRCRTGSPRICK